MRLGVLASAAYASGGIRRSRGPVCELMKALPPEDQPDEIWIGPLGPIPIIDEDDPRFEAERAAQSAANKKAQALHSADELLEGLRDPDWRVRLESVPRLAVRWKGDPRTLEAILHAAANDESWQVRGAAVMKLTEFERWPSNPPFVSP